MNRWGERFFSSTRGRIVRLLRRGEASVGDLAEALGITGNAVRSHLTTLERDRLVKPAGKRPGTRKPEVLYTLTAEAEQLFPKAYGLLLNLLLTAVRERLAPDAFRDMLRAMGRTLAAGQPDAPRPAALRDRLENATGVLDALGGLAEVEDVDGQLGICGYSCPVAAVAREHPEVCQLAASLLTELVDAPVEERCDRSGAPQCRFAVVAPPA